MTKDRDEEFKPKRQVNNRKSKFIPHVISDFISPTTGRKVGCESQGEELIFSILEMSRYVEDYYHQPVEVDVKFHENNELKSWKHVADAIAFPEYGKPCLIQVKGGTPDKGIKPKDIHIFRACDRLARKKEWIFRVLYPKTIDENVKSNIKALFPFLTAERGNEVISDMLIRALDKNEVMTMERLACIGEPDISRLDVLPVIRHELAMGNFYTDLYKPISLKSKIRIALESDEDLYKKYVLEVNNHEGQFQQWPCPESR